MCPHLLGDDAGADHVRLLTGRGIQFDMCCPVCGESADEGRPVTLLIACEGCVARCAEADWSLRAWRGTPGIAERPEPLDPTVRETPLPVDAVDFAPVETAGSVWLLLDREGRIGRFDADSGSWAVQAGTTVPAEPEHRPRAGHELRRRLHTCGDGRFAAVVNDFGRHGQVLDLRI